MRKTLKIADSIITKTMKASDDNIPQIIHRKAVDFEMKWGRAPTAFLIGPNEFMCLIKILKDSVFGEQCKIYLREPEQFMGMDIRLKQSPGIEMEFPKEMWPLITMGRIR